MRIVMLLCFLLTAPTVHASEIKTPEDLIREMQKKYAQSWYKTLTFVQKTTEFQADGKTTFNRNAVVPSSPGLAASVTLGSRMKDNFQSRSGCVISRRIKGGRNRFAVEDSHETLT